MSGETLAPDAWDVAVVGGGPAGLAAATRLRECGVGRVLVLEREAEAGGIPRHCGHPPFGMRELRRCTTGPRYAHALVERARGAGAEVRTETTVVATEPGGTLTLSSPDGLDTLRARRVLLATGVRETPRSARFVSGARPLGVLTTGALQGMVYLKQAVPFHRPLIVGSELVSFSSLLTCRHAGIRPVAMIEPSDRITARWFCRGLPMLLGVPLLLGCSLLEILGKTRVTGALVRMPGGAERHIDCDGVLFTGNFTPESTLVRMGHLLLDPATGGPVVDGAGRCSDPAYYAAGNLLRPVETAGWCWHEGLKTAERLVADLEGRPAASDASVAVRCRSSLLRFAVPQRVRIGSLDAAQADLQLRFAGCATGTLTLSQNDRVLWSRSMAVRPERRVLIPAGALTGLVPDAPLDIAFAPVGA